MISPIRHVDFDNPEEKKVHDDLVALVDRMLELNKRLKGAVGREREELERTDMEIDALAYELYGLTGEERRVVEGGTLNHGNAEGRRAWKGTIPCPPCLRDKGRTAD